ncbi:hypothetical protein FVB32_11685 [Flagellimonas hymeniacidonis]|uniref:Uncharacterized protein n=1 Tax=Flagellimonas hymeniacidonis TaxID=2603628 RepID=A0A5C8V2D4_9FLAO|nr:hypothetical protein [Flagellimonas hymeniacidonis]TXN35242.1 hypothetical protein FVB32_11685 [Flagellimonas hymeniacidonis]
MEKSKVESRYKIGDIVCAKVRPSVLLVVRLYARKVYYCTIQNDPLANELVYFDRELKSCDGIPLIQKT